VSEVERGHGDAYAPPVVAVRVRDAGVTKLRRAGFPTFVLSVLAGAFIGLGALFYVVVVTDAALGFGVTRLLGGLAFSLGLILVVVAGAELFTGNVLVAMAWASRLVRTGEVVRHWSLVFVGNAVGALGTVALVWLGEIHTFGAGAVGASLSAIGEHKTSLSVVALVALGTLCNALVCLAVWLAQAARSVTDKVLAIVFPITAFVAVGAEHSIANLFLLPWAWLVGGLDAGFASATLVNLAAVTVGNLLGGTVLVAAVYWLAYLRPGADDASGHEP